MQLRGMRLVLATGAVAMVVAVAFFSGVLDRDGNKKAPTPVAPPRAEAPSPVLGLPLPQGNAAAPDLSLGGVEAFRLARDQASFADVEAFYTKEMDGRDFRGYAWCGRTATADGQDIVRIWWHPDAPGSVSIQLHYDPAEGTQILVSENSDTQGVECPPPAPEE